MKLKKMIALLLACVMLFALASCGGDSGSGGSESPSQSQAPSESQQPSEAPSESQGSEPAGDGNDLTANLTLATYPVGKMTDETVVNELIADFNAVYPNVNVTVVYLDYTNGDQTLNGMVEGGNAPDLIFEGPERLVAQWGAKGYLVDLKDLVPPTWLPKLPSGL